MRRRSASFDEGHRKPLAEQMRGSVGPIMEVRLNACKRSHIQ